MDHKRPTAFSFACARVRTCACMSLIASLVFCAVPEVQAVPASKPSSVKSAADLTLRRMPVEDLIRQMYARRGPAQRDVMDELVRRGPEADRLLLKELPGHPATIMHMYFQKGASALPRLIALQGDPETVIVHAAGKALANAAAPAGAAHANALLKCLKDHPELQYCGMALTKVMGPASAGFAPKLVKELGSRKMPVRLFSATSLGQIGAAAGPQAVTALAQRLSDQDPSVTWAAAAALGRMGRAAKGAVPALEKAVASPDHELQNQAKEALTHIPR
jgi:hypothetical protein